MLETATNSGDDVHFLHAFHLKFRNNLSIVNIPVEATFSMSISWSDHHGQYFLTVGLSLHLLCPDLPDPSSLTECTSDNQCLGTSNFTTSVAKHSTLKSQLDWGTDYSLASFPSQ